MKNEERWAEEDAIRRYVSEAIDKAIADPDVWVWSEGPSALLTQQNDRSGQVGSVDQKDATETAGKADTAICHRA